MDNHHTNMKMMKHIAGLCQSLVQMYIAALITMSENQAFTEGQTNRLSIAGSP
jgi:hypothetical protein